MKPIPAQLRPAALVLGTGLLLGACTVIPTGPSVLAMPGSRKSAEHYQADVVECRQYADSVIAANAGSTAAAADEEAAHAAATGALLGAATGAVIGAASGHAGHGAAVGAGTGLLFGGLAGSAYPSMSSYQLQRGYDRAYLQCMYSRGNRVPVRAAAPGPARPSYLPAGPSAAAYPPPPNTPPPAGLPGSPAPRPGGTVYPLPLDIPPSSYPPPNTPPPAGLPPRN